MPDGLLSLGIAPSTVVDGQSALGTLAIPGAAPTGGREVFLTSSNSAVTVTSEVIVPSGSKTKTFTVQASAVASTTTAKVVARAGTVQRAVTVTVNP